MLFTAAQKRENAEKLGESAASKMLCSLLIKDLPQIDEINNARGKKTNDLKTITRIEFKSYGHGEENLFVLVN